MRIEDKIFQILSRELQLDMPKPVKAKRKVVNDIIALLDSSQEEPTEGLREDLKQYITNALYYAYSFNTPVKVTSDFDKWVEEQVNGVDEYLKEKGK
jgi:hypothetical protein